MDVQSKTNTLTCTVFGRHVYPRVIDQPWARVDQQMLQIAPTPFENVCVPNSKLSSVIQSESEDDIISEFLQHIPFKQQSSSEVSKMKDSILELDLVDDLEFILRDIDMNGVGQQSEYNDLNACLKDLISSVDNLNFFQAEDVHPESTEIKKSELLKVKNRNLADIEEQLWQCQMQLAQVDAQIDSLSAPECHVPAIETTRDSEMHHCNKLIRQANDLIASLSDIQ